ncbi:hypothetical protein BP6252_10245 [Coleophoma cylindrospora]|uniref:AB hydrolase-1 domain-containing protein n=1 Tax=Coleophoma cylindrospora TaxID=1849047 RepID=A0A3D8QSW2_9HELO|nr:hypothetical protein BP6252_10245 [Coleophoma cylindrospora]
MAKPTIVFVPGLWEGPAVFEGVASVLETHGYPTAYAPLASTGHASPGNPNMLDDMRCIRSAIKPLVSAGKEIVMVCHSVGGCLGSAAIKDLDKKSRSQSGAEGGVIQLVFLAAGLAPVGFRHPETMPFFDIKGNEMFCADPMSLLMNDLPADIGKSWVEKLQRQPATGWADAIEYCGWEAVPSVYVLATKDACIPIEMQTQAAELASSKLEKVDCGHMVMLSQPNKVVEIVRRAAGEDV